MHSGPISPLVRNLNTIVTHYIAIKPNLYPIDFNFIVLVENLTRWIISWCEMGCEVIEISPDVPWRRRDEYFLYL